MSNRPLTFVLIERKAALGKLKGKVVVQARPTGRKRVHHRNFCTEVAHGTTFSSAEVEAVLRLAAEIAKRHVENGDIVDFGDIGMLTPSFKSKLVDKEKETFNANVHITKPKVRLLPSRKYFTLTDVSYERIGKPAKKGKDKKPNSGSDPTPQHP
ncbi:histidinol phosphate phosphatase [Prevotella nigrescens]|jgi:putative DNA-binding protein|uniref:HU family DNA-binding protein n=1 Tax=Prevotella nigrescens TaxID=28133 RepID=UPI001CB2DE88|nr:histidinol phosphate phosphatase [Prevotella nigrescens]MBF1457387.1 histidinol phosphate phosphatase [Prevotella nigrescens]